MGDHVWLITSRQTDPDLAEHSWVSTESATVFLVS
jgi:hypothetical protein